MLLLKKPHTLDTELGGAVLEAPSWGPPLIAVEGTVQVETEKGSQYSCSTISMKDSIHYHGKTSWKVFISWGKPPSYWLADSTGGNWCVITSIHLAMYLTTDEIRDLRGESITVTSLNQNNNLLHYKYLLSYPHISLGLTPHQRTLFRNLFWSLQ